MPTRETPGHASLNSLIGGTVGVSKEININYLENMINCSSNLSVNREIYSTIALQFSDHSITIFDMLFCLFCRAGVVVS